MKHRRVAFFDLDGTLVAPRFYIDTAPVIGFVPNDWAAYCKNHVDAYKHSIVVPSIINYARNLDSIGWELHILTAADTKPDMDAKSGFIKSSVLSSIFHQIHFVRSSKDKFGFIDAFLNIENLDPQDCLLVEDTFPTLWECCKLNIRVMHVSHITSECYDANTFNLV